VNKIDFYKREFNKYKKYDGKIFLSCCVSTDFDYDILPHFMRHYKDIGVDEFLIILHVISDDLGKLEYCQKILRDFGVKEKKIWRDDYDPVLHTSLLMKLNKEYAETEDWVLTIDIDEFHEYCCDLRKIIAYCEERNINFISGNFVDRLTEDGKIVDINNKTDLFESFPVKSEVFRNVFHGCHWKVMIHKCYIDLIPGQHFVKDSDTYVPISFPEVFSVNHFKWRGDLIENNSYRSKIFNKNKDKWDKHKYKDKNNNLTSDWIMECGDVVKYYKKNGTFKNNA
jgi:hypothetical protein